MDPRSCLFFLLLLFTAMTDEASPEQQDDSSSYFSTRICDDVENKRPASSSDETTAFERLNSMHKSKVLTSNGEPIRILTSSLAPIIVAKWDSSEPVVSLTGYAPYMFDLVAKRAGFQYCWVSLGKNTSLVRVDDSPGRKGLISHLTDGKGDILIAALLRTTDRFKYLDFTVPTADGPLSIMIPFPETSVNSVNALIQPFQLEVWMNLLVAVVFVILSLYFFTRAFKSFTNQQRSSGSAKLYDTFTYVITILLTQGNHFANHKMASHFTAGAWCLGAFVLAAAYSGTLLSFIMSPIRKPVIETIFDIPQVPGLKVTVDRGRAADTLLESIQDNSNFGKMVTVIKKTIFRCNTSKECIDEVLAGGHVYIHGKPTINQIIIDDLEKMGKCRFSEAKESFFNGFLAWGLPKKSPFSSAINNAILELDAYGLSQFWKARFVKGAKKCVNPEESLRISRLSLSHLSGTFALLGVGYSLGLFMFAIEKLVQRFHGTHASSARTPMDMIL